MVFNLTYVFGDDSLNTSPGSPPAFSASPSVASPRACNGCIGVISRFDESQLRGRLEYGPSRSSLLGNLIIVPNNDLKSSIPCENSIFVSISCVRDRGAAEEMQDEDSGGRNGSVGKANRIAKVTKVKEVSLFGKAVKVLDAIGGSMTNLNMNNSFMSRSTANEGSISVLAFEVANTITKGANLMQSLAEQNIVYLKEEVLPSEGVQYLVSTDMDELLRIAAADQRKELQLFTKEVVRLGNLCVDPQWHNLDRYFKKSGLAYETPLKKDAWAVMLPLMNLVQPTAELYHKLHAFNRCQQEYWHKLQEHISLDAKDKDESLPILRSEVRSQTRHLKTLKKKSLWSRAPGEVVEKLVDIVCFLQSKVHEAFGSADFEREAGGSASNGSKLGSSGMALHYASIITLIDNIVAHSGFVPPTMTNALYQSLPPGIKSALHFWLRQVPIREEPTIPIIKAKMEETLSWLAPVAASTIKSHYGFARLGEWPNVRVSQRRTGKDDFVTLNTLYHADKEKTDSYIVELLFWLHQLVSKRRAMNNGVTCSLDSMVSSLSDEEITLSSRSLRNDVDKRKLMPRTRETLESETETTYSCYCHLLCTGVWDSPTNRSFGLSALILKTLSMDFGIDMMTALDVIDGVTTP